MELVSHISFQILVNGQLTHCENIRDKIMCLKANESKRYHLGIGEVVSLINVTRINESRSHLIYEDLVKLLIKQAKQLYVGDDGLEVSLKNNEFAFDNTTIAFCLSTFYKKPSEAQKGA